MRIEGVNNFISRIIQSPIQITEKSPIGPYVIRKETDILDISEAGRRLRFRPDATILNEVQATTGGDPILNLMNKSLSGVESVLEQMKALAELAQESYLTIVDRLKLQIEMEKLREGLNDSTNAMSEKFAAMSGLDMEKYKRVSEKYVPEHYKY